MTACGISWSLTSLFNSSLKCGDLPSGYKAALVTPVPKNGSGDLVGNYRPISVLSVVVKVLERLVHRQLYAYLCKPRYEISELIPALCQDSSQNASTSDH